MNQIRWLLMSDEKQRERFLELRRELGARRDPRHRALLAEGDDYIEQKRASAHIERTASYDRAAMIAAPFWWFARLWRFG